MLAPIAASLRLAPVEAFVYPPCIYFLLEQGVVVYVGQTVGLPARVANHVRDGKSFDAVAHLAVDRADLDRVESAFIRFLRPPLNASNGPMRATDGEDAVVLRGLGFDVTPVAPLLRGVEEALAAFDRGDRQTAIKRMEEVVARLRGQR